MLRWRARGEAQSAPLPAAGAAAGDGTRLQIEAGVSCRAGAVVVADDAVRLFRTRAGTFACRRAPRARPVRIAPPRGHVALVTRAGRTLGYVVRRGTRETLNVLDLHRRRLRSSARSAGPYGARERILGLDPADSGGLAVVTESGTGRSVQYLAPAAGALARPREVARLATSRIDPATLRLRAREITWSAIGAPRSARL